jgi:hypothetical protein
MEELWGQSLQDEERELRGTWPKAQRSINHRAI